MKPYIFSATILMLALVSCKTGNSQFTATDYSNPENWMVKTIWNAKENCIKRIAAYLGHEPR